MASAGGARRLSGRPRAGCGLKMSPCCSVSDWGLLLPLAHPLPSGLTRGFPGSQRQLEHVRKALWELGWFGDPWLLLHHHLSLVVLSGDPRSRSPASASPLKTVDCCCCRQPVPCPGLSLCCLLAGEEVTCPVRECLGQQCMCGPGGRQGCPHP